MFYPWVSDFLVQINAKSQTKVYDKKMESYSEEEKKEMFLMAHQYNEMLFLQKQEKKSYESLLNLDGKGMMGYIDIPSISVKLPIYHGTASEVLEYGIGHLETSSLPVGGENTHAVLTGHTGLSNARLFTDIRMLKKGNLFFVHVLGETMAYRVIDIYTVLPQDTTKLQIEEKEDFVTLVTCTPYGVNSHRLLVRGKRTWYIKGMEKIEMQQNRDNKTKWMNKDRMIVETIILVFGLLSIIKYRCK